MVGEVAPGGAHQSWPRRVTDHFYVNVPGARMTSPVSGTDCEGRGVQPDVRVPDAEALDVARRLVRERLAQRRQSPRRHAE